MDIERDNDLEPSASEMEMPSREDPGNQSVEPSATEDPKLEPLNSDSKGNDKEMNTMSKSQRLKEILRQKTLIQKSPRASATPSQSTKTVRIDNFQRPLNLKVMLQWLSGLCETVIEEKNVWINNIKTHCYIDFDTTELAEKCICKVTGLKYPATSTSLLVANFTTTSAIEAPSSVEASLPPSEWKSPAGPKVQLTDGKSVLGKRKSEESENVSSSSSKLTRLGGNLFLKATEGALLSHNTSAKTSNIYSGTSQNKIESQANRNGRIVHLQGEQQPLKVKMALEDIFRKTLTQPHIFWMPVSEDQAEKRRIVHFSRKSKS